MTKKSDEVISRIPSATIVRQRLRETQVEVRQLEILLDVAERLEAVKDPTWEVARV